MSIPIHLSPSSGFCIKSSTLQPASIAIQNEQFDVPSGLKIFVNIAWDANVPPPPEASDETIRRAVQGVDESSSDAWFVPVVVSEGRKDTDKAGKEALVFDCVYNSSLKTRSLADPDFKIFLVELSLQRVEAQTSIVLSRQIGTPNIRSKGKLTPRTVLVPPELFARLGTNLPSQPRSTISPSESATPSVSKKPLIEEITQEGKKVPPTSFDGKLKGILKSAKAGRPEAKPSANLPPVWKWSKEDEQLRITVAVPNLTHDLIKSTALDIEARRLILNIPGRPMLDINLGLSDVEIVAHASARRGAVSASAADIHRAKSADEDQVDTQGGNHEASSTLTLKRQRDFNVESTRAEWRVADGVLVIFA